MSRLNADNAVNHAKTAMLLFQTHWKEHKDLDRIVAALSGMKPLDAVLVAQSLLNTFMPKEVRQRLVIAIRDAAPKSR